jgi:hypothetical protein
MTIEGRQITHAKNAGTTNRKSNILRNYIVKLTYAVFAHCSFLLIVFAYVA